jgi:L-rhamnose mutarotase
MKLKPGCIEEYERRHAAIWPELAEALRAAGISDYSIYLDEQTLALFAVHKCTPDNTIAELPRLPIMQKWWAYMAPLMEVNPDNSPRCGPLREVFRMG